MAVCCSWTLPAAGAGTSTCSRSMTSGPPVSLMRMARGIGCSSTGDLRRVTPLAMLGEIQSFGFLVLTDTETYKQSEKFEDSPGHQRAPCRRREHSQCLNA